MYSINRRWGLCTAKECVSYDRSPHREHSHNNTTSYNNRVSTNALTEWVNMQKDTNVTTTVARLCLCEEHTNGGYAVVVHIKCAKNTPSGNGYLSTTPETKAMYKCSK